MALKNCSQNNLYTTWLKYFFFLFNFLGHYQPGCGIDILGMCSHNRVYEYFAESLLSRRFIAKRCAILSNALLGLCNGNKTAIMGGEPMNFNQRGIFFLKTNGKSPYALVNSE